MLTKWYRRSQLPERSLRIIKGSSLAALGLLYLKVWLPMTGLGIPCVFHELTGLDCPGCGMTRAVLALLELDVNQAIRNNPLLLVIPPLYAAYLAAHRKKLRLVSGSLMAIMLAVTVGFGILRNMPHNDTVLGVPLGLDLLAPDLDAGNQLGAAFLNHFAQLLD
jgi:hypothetical protein